MYKNEDFDAFSTVTLTITIARDGSAERGVIADMIYALTLYSNTLPHKAPAYVKEISLI